MKTALWPIGPVFPGIGPLFSEGEKEKPGSRSLSFLSRVGTYALGQVGQSRAWRGFAERYRGLALAQSTGFYWARSGPALDQPCRIRGIFKLLYATNRSTPGRIPQTRVRPGFGDSMRRKPRGRRAERRKGRPEARVDAFGPAAIHEVRDALQTEARNRTKRRGLSKNREEHREQKKFVLWARDRGLEVSHQNNGASTKARRIHLHQMGCTAGAADLLIFDRLPKFPEARGLAIEFKSSTGSRSPAQTAWADRLKYLGWICHVARTADEAKSICIFYGL